MPMVLNVEKKVFSKEGFHVVMKSPDGNEVKDHQKLQGQYDVQKMSRYNMTVNEWKHKFTKQFPGYDVEVLKGDGSKAEGDSLLISVRETYWKKK